MKPGSDPRLSRPPVGGVPARAVRPRLVLRALALRGLTERGLETLGELQHKQRVRGRDLGCVSACLHSMGGDRCFALWNVGFLPAAAAVHVSRWEGTRGWYIVQPWHVWATRGEGGDRATPHTAVALASIQ